MVKVAIHGSLAVWWREEHFCLKFENQVKGCGGEGRGKFGVTLPPGQGHEPISPSTVLVDGWMGGSQEAYLLLVSPFSFEHRILVRKHVFKFIERSHICY